MVIIISLKYFKFDTYHAIFQLVAERIEFTNLLFEPLDALTAKFCRIIMNEKVMKGLVTQ